jgi:tetratricopeptide (TPR) repeat protein
MTDINPVLVEKYQLILQSDPGAKVFAPLAEAYRKMGLVDEGIQICLKGLQHHPDFASGRVALGRLYLEKGDLERSVPELEKAVDLSPENLLAQSLLGEAYLKLRRPKDALMAFKMLLFLNPNDDKAQSAVRKLESLTADEYDEDVFAMTKLQQAAEKVQNVEMETPEALRPLNPDDDSDRQKRDLDRYVSLADAFLVRNDFERARATLEEAEQVHGHRPEISKRLKLLNQRFDEDADPVPPPEPRETQIRDGQIALLQEMDRRVRANRRKT